MGMLIGDESLETDTLVTGFVQQAGVKMKLGVGAVEIANSPSVATTRLTLLEKLYKLGDYYLNRLAIFLEYKAQVAPLT
jgi:hypothetical protein